MRFHLFVAGRAGDEFHDVAALRGALHGSLSPPSHHDDTAHWQRLHQVVQSLHDLVSDGRAQEAVQFAEQVVDVLAGAAHQVTGQWDELADLAQRALAAHATACRLVRPDPYRLAGWLIRLQLTHPDGPEVRLAEYTEALGSAGLAYYRQGAESACRGLPTIRFGQPGRYDRHRAAVTKLVEELAAHTGDPDLTVQILATDLSTAWQYLRIASVLEEAGRSEQALAWVERGLVAAKGTGAVPRLVDLAVDQCVRLGRLDRAVELRRTAFRARPGLDAFLRLRAVADHDKSWERERQRVLRWLRQPGEDELTRNTALVEILLWEGDRDAARRAAAERGCAPEVRARVDRFED
ncbi:hypothetical protein N8J89_14010 [Crossiella sp. CA-258035]|uniref:hypothetical protein n=1 Tax=Crossiella sp. CA-258035 TaxID=2981138 RepID=UPI0024BCB750|nr:hypothetical protein [Crossiella sp. CA-258035]WHT22131.1 hypothetical protein N8J89_14010 [Crossiella sp. CA-258035]